jgi:Helix-turn-helix domain
MRAKPPKKEKDKKTGPRRIDGEVLDVTSAARLLGTSEKCIRARVARQLLPHRKWAGRVIFLRDDVMAFLTKLDGVSVDEALANAAARNGEPTS